MQNHRARMLEDCSHESDSYIRSQVMEVNDTKYKKEWKRLTVWHIDTHTVPTFCTFHETIVFLLPYFVKLFSYDRRISLFYYRLQNFIRL